MKYTIKPTSQCKKDLKRGVKQKRNIEELTVVINTIAVGKKLEEKCYDHSLSGKLRGKRECHVEPDWLLIYALKKDVAVLSLDRVGSHAELYGL